MAKGHRERSLDEESLIHSEDRPIDLANLQTTIKSPLTGLSRVQLLQNVEEFAREKKLIDILPILSKGAVLTQNSAEFEELDELDDGDKDLIRHERSHKWSYPFTLYLTIFMCSVGAATQGWDQTGSNGANLSFPSEFGISAQAGEPNYERDSWLVGFINAAPYITSLCGCWLSDPLNNHFGRRGTIFFTALILVATPIASAFTHSWGALFAVRLLLGIGMGAKASTVPIFAAENAPAQIRGALVMGWQLWTAFGIFLGFAANMIVENTGRIAWRLQLGSAFIPAVPLAVGIYFCPESPRWLMKKNRYREAYHSFCCFRHSPLQAARDLYYIHVQLEEEKKVIRADNYITRFMELFTIPRVRAATIASSIVMTGQQVTIQMCGINIIAFYSSTVFVLAHYTDHQALYASLGFGAINFLFGIPALFTIDTFGRRSMLLFIFPQMAWSLLATGFCFSIPESAGTVRIGFIAFFIYLYSAFYSTGEGPVPFTYAAEVFPLAQREQGMAFAVGVSTFWASVLSITFPRLLQTFTPTGAFGFYAGLNVIAFVMIFLFVPETKQRTLEELNQVFSVPTSVFARRQITEALLYFNKRWPLLPRNTRLDPLYILVDDLDDINNKDDTSDNSPVQ